MLGLFCFCIKGKCHSNIALNSQSGLDSRNGRPGPLTDTQSVAKLRRGQYFIGLITILPNRLLNKD